MRLRLGTQIADTLQPRWQSVGYSGVVRDLKVWLAVRLTALLSWEMLERT